MGYHGDTYREFCCSGFEAKGDSRNFLSMRFLINPNREIHEADCV